ncbi:MAG: serine hydrolase [Flavobacteriales bacterium]
MKYINQTNLLLLLFILISSCSGQTKTDKIDKLEELITRYADYGQFNGSVLVAEKGAVIYKKGFGWANMESGSDNLPDTKFRLASVTKQFTAMLVVQLASENKLKLDVPISTYLPDYPKKTADIVTIHHLLTHTSGIPNYTDFPSIREVMQKKYSPAELVKLFADSTLEFTPGEKYHYSNSGYILLGYIIEKITGKSYEEVLQNKIFTPLKMINSGYDNNAELRNKAFGYNKTGNTLAPANYIDMSVPFAAGGIYSTVEDLFLWDQALYTEKLLPKKYMDLLFTKHVSEGGPSFYGYGWQLGNMPIGSTNENIAIIYHSGFINGFNTNIARIPSDKSSIILLNNTAGAPLDEMTVAIAAILYGKPYDFPKKSIAYSLLDVIEKDGIDAALSYYREIKNSPTHYFNESEINDAGYLLLNTGKANEAAVVFKLNTEEYPNSFNTFDSYADALVALGDTTRAIENYRKCLKLNPGHENSLKRLKEFGVNTDTLIKKVSIEELKLVEGQYLITNPPSDNDKDWKIEFKVVKGELTGNDRGYKYKLVPVGNNAFVNPDDGASLVFDTSDKNATTLVLFKKYKFKRVL